MHLCKVNKIAFFVFVKSKCSGCTITQIVIIYLDLYLLSCCGYLKKKNKGAAMSLNVFAET